MLVFATKNHSNLWLFLNIHEHEVAFPEISGFSFTKVRFTTFCGKFVRKKKPIHRLGFPDALGTHVLSIIILIDYKRSVVFLTLCHRVCATGFPPTLILHNGFLKPMHYALSTPFPRIHSWFQCQSYALMELCIRTLCIWKFQLYTQHMETRSSGLRVPGICRPFSRGFCHYNITRYRE